jgi:phospholipid/cholesterol/gamma-HCH transport system substrate-binding protein
VNLRREARWIWPIAAIMAIAVVCAAYILSHQRLESPFADRYELHLEFEAVHAVTPGVGAPVTVAGVTVGQIDGVRLAEGRGVLRVRMNPGELPRVYEGATAALVPNTPLKDMQVRLDPGERASRPLPDGATIPLRATTSPIDADELLRALDRDTRDWTQSLIADLGVGTRGRKADLRALLRNLGPTAAQMRAITSLLADRRHKLPALVHDLRVVTEATADGDHHLRRTVDAGNATLAAIAANDEPLKQALEELPPTLAAARSTLERTPPFAESLRRSLAALDPTLEALPRTLRESPGALRGLMPLPIGPFSDFIDAVAPLARSVRPASRDLVAGTPALEKAFAALARTTDALAYQAGPDSQSYLFWMAWFAHNLNSVFSTQDAHGAVLRGYVLFSCASSGASPELAGLLETALGPQGSCPEGAGR